ncbi:MAG TPA: ABC transporter ATP-binding protein [Solirubrobacter sp.]|nr:ABC transporter ATP-binding protein [Solirubrobacter sp.]
MTALELDRVSLKYGGVEAVRELSLTAGPGEIVALLGPSGAGKSTTLRIAAGIDKPSRGRVLVDGTDVTKQHSWKRNAAMVFESYVLYPQLSVFDNIAFPLRAPAVRARYDEAEIQRRVEAIAKTTEIDHLLARKPAELSGGQRQRVALSRALVRDPSTFLLDEPIAHLDAKLRHWLRGELRRTLTARDVPTIWATPDGLEAMAVADRIALIIDGRIVQEGTPREVFTSPATAKAARLLGDPAMNVVDVVIDATGEVRVGDLNEHGIRLGGWTDAPGKALAGVRPAELRLADSNGPGRLPAEVIGVEAGTRETVVIARVGGQAMRVTTRERLSLKASEWIWIDWSEATVHVFAAEGDGQLRTEASVDTTSPTCQGMEVSP